ncbi:NUDIX hydrolase [Patescibacteria group bacterium]|nr:NUDIX hydrolase [Patescibacteria group bacterium]MBU1886030.1 NUDIX hydrolase [Patescibacteria group bacterium]
MVLTNGKQIDDFYVTTLADSVHVIAITKEKQVVLIRMYKQGADDIMIQFPAGRREDRHKDLLDVAVSELEEETGIEVGRSDLNYLGKLAIMSTKATELAHYYLVTDVEINSQQSLDENEEIEVLFLELDEIEKYIAQGKIWDALCIAGWDLAKKKKGIL